MRAGGEDTTAVLRLCGDIDAASQAAYRVAGDELLTGSDGAAPSLLTVDMAEVETIDSSGLGLLVHLHNLARTRGVNIALANVPPRSDALLRRTGLHRVFGIEDD